MRKTPQVNGALDEMLAAEHGIPPQGGDASRLESQGLGRRAGQA